MMRYIFIMLIFITTISLANDDSTFDEFEEEFIEEKKDTFDPLEPYNEVMTFVNDTIYLYALEPTSKTYGNILPQDLRSAISNIFNNILFPVRFVNNILQLKPKESADELYRFVLNSTLGFAGMNDIAKKKFNIKAHNEDFGQTLGFYGISADIHLVLPLLGPSNARDTLGLVVDSFASPLSHVKTVWDSRGLQTWSVINKSSHNPTEYRVLTKDAIKLYPFLKNVYEQRRNAMIQE